jgi:NAD(P)-dependent dehydrogenase (short-subunit alcohol dehydrogenase family)
MSRIRKLAVISGASRGLGFELSPLIEKMGYQVIRLGFSSPGIVDFRCDLTSRESTDACVTEIRAKFGEIDLLVSNAGTGKKPAVLQSYKSMDNYFFDVNYVTAKNLIEALLPSLRASQGSIIAISSIVALKKIVDAPDGYTEAKKKLNLYIRSLAKQEAKHGVRANIVSPGNMMFPNSRWAELMLEKPEFVQNKIENEVPLGAFISPFEIAAAISYLTSAQAVNITGTNLVIDGGQSL